MLDAGYIDQFTVLQLVNPNSNKRVTSGNTIINDDLIRRTAHYMHCLHVCVLIFHNEDRCIRLVCVEHSSTRESIALCLAMNTDKGTRSW